MAPDRVVGTMVWCVSCKSVVWAHDADHSDVRGIANMFRLRCPLCRVAASFDGILVHREMLGQLAPWVWMHCYADQNNLDWRNSDDLTWYGPRS